MAETPKFEVGQSCGNVFKDIGLDIGVAPVTDADIEDFIKRTFQHASPKGVVGRALRIIVHLQSELASLRAQGDAEWNAGRDAVRSLAGEGRFRTDGNCSWSKFLLDEFKEEARALTRPTTPSPDEAKGGE